MPSRSKSRLKPRELALVCQLDRTVTYRLLRTLEASRFVEKFGDGFDLGPRTALLGQRYLRRLPLRNASLPHQLELLFGRFEGRPWALSVLMHVGTEMVVVSQIFSPTAPIESLLRVNEQLPIDVASSGRCVLAFLPDEEVRALIGKSAARRLAPILRAVRKTGGIAPVTLSELPGTPKGLTAISALISTRSGKPIGALTLSGTELEPHLKPGSDVAARLLRTAGKIGQLLD